MTGASQDAEQVRRYPLTWTVLGQAFLKIPPQTLGRVLADRKFTSVLRQTLDDVYKSLAQPSPELEKQLPQIPMPEQSGLEITRVELEGTKFPGWEYTRSHEVREDGSF